MRLLVAGLVFGGVLACAQGTVQVTRAELAVPFGSINGKLVTVGDQLVFVDDERPEASFSVNRADVDTARTENGQLAIQLRRPARIRGAEQSRLVIRVNEADAAGISRWAGAAGTSGAALAASDNRLPVTTPGTAAESGTPLFNLEARHNHRIGNCRGRLVLTANSLAFESLSEVNDSRQWSLRDIKELRRKGPYELVIEPFDGAMYRFELPGSGMDNDQYKTLADRVAAARATR